MNNKHTEVEEIVKQILKLFIEMQLYEPYEEDTDQSYHLNDECMLVTYKQIEKETGVEKKVAKPVVIGMRNDGLLELTPAVDMEYYMPNGSGYMLTKKGVEYVNKNLPYVKPTIDPTRKMAETLNMRLLQRDGNPIDKIVEALTKAKEEERTKHETTLTYLRMAYEELAEENPERPFVIGVKEHLKALTPKE